MAVRYNPAYRTPLCDTSITMKLPTMLTKYPVSTNGARLFTLSDQIPVDTDTIAEATRIGDVNRLLLMLSHPNVDKIVGTASRRQHGKTI